MRISDYSNKVIKSIAYIAPQLGLVIAAIISSIVTIKTGLWFQWGLTCSIFPCIGLIFQIVYFEYHKKD